MYPNTTTTKAYQVSSKTPNAISPVTEDCPVEVFRWGGAQDHHLAEAPHAHPFDEILLFNRGGGKHLINGIWHPVESASVHFLKVGAEHLLDRAQTADGGTVLFLREYIALEPQLPFKQLFFLEASPVLQLSQPDFAELWLVYEQLLREAQEKQRFYRKQSILSWLNAFLVKVAEHYRSSYPDALENGAPANPLAQAFQEAVAACFRAEKSVEFYARRLFVAPKQLHEISRKHLGKCPQDVIADHILAEALAQLHAGAGPIKNIAADLGFYDPAYFSRFIKKRTGKSPVEWQCAA